MLKVRALQNVLLEKAQEVGDVFYHEDNVRLRNAIQRGLVQVLSDKSTEIGVRQETPVPAAAISSKRRN